MTEKRTFDEERIARAMVFSLDSASVYNALLELDAELKDPMFRMIQEAHRIQVQNEGRLDIHAVVGEFIKLGGNELDMIERLDGNDWFKIEFAEDVAKAVERLNREDNASKYEESLKSYVSGEICHKELMQSISHSKHETESDVWDLSDIHTAVFDHDPTNIVELGFHKFDRFHGGMERGRVTILAARPGVGKTDLAMHTIRHNLKLGKNVVFFSIEMDAREIGYRMGRAENYGKYGKEGTLEGINNVKAFPGKLTVYGKADPTASYVSARVHTDTDLVVVDYLQIMKASTKDGQYEMTTELSNDVRKAAKRSNAAWLVLSQLNRDQANENAAPTLKHLRGSGAIEQDAFAVIFAYMPNGRVKPGNEQDLTLAVEKNRNGALGSFEVYCDRIVSRWRE